MHISIVSPLPDTPRHFLSASVLGRALSQGAFGLTEVPIRSFSTNKHNKIDDSPCGGGPGQVIAIDATKAALDHAVAQSKGSVRIILTDPAARAFHATDAKRLAEYDSLVFVCGRYEGIDARIHHYVDEAFSIGDYVLSSGELAATVMIDAVLRFVPGVLGNEASSAEESHESGLLEHSQYTRPIEFEGHKVPDWLLSGNHQLIAKNRKIEQRFRTQQVRPDLCKETAPIDPGQAGPFAWQKTVKPSTLS